MNKDCKTVLYFARANLEQLAEDAALDLRTTEGDSNIAELQGFCCGAELVQKMLLQAGFEAIDDKSVYLRQIESFDYDELCLLVEQAEDVQKTPEWESFLTVRADAISEKKDFLYCECKKGRDLAFIKGWKKSVEYVDKYFSALIEKHQKETEAGQPLPFD